MSIVPPLNVKKGSGRGRPRDEDEPRHREPSGRLAKLKPRSAGPTPEALAQRRAIAADPVMAENPLDAAYSNGWLDRDTWRAGKLYALSHRLAYRDVRGPGVALSSLPASQSSDGEGEIIPAGLTIDDLFSRLYHLFASGGPISDPEKRERDTAAAMARLRIMNAAMTQAQRSEVHMICVIESWPQWFVHRQAGNVARKRFEADAEAERRGLSEAELAHLAKRFNSPWERKRDMLIAGLRAVAKAANPSMIDPDHQIHPVPEMRQSIPAPSRSNGTVEVYINRGEAEECT